MADNRKFITCDGNYAAAWVSYAFTETAGIYPITPSTDMAEHTDSWAANGKKNIFGDTVKVVEMQSEAGAAGVVHGALQAGALTTTYTASQGLLLMLPNMYKIAGELLPAVFHVSARSIATHALSIFGDHSDVYSARMTGFAMLSSGSVQEVMDLGAVAHLAALKGKVPFMHFFDGFRTSHEIQKIQAWDYADLSKLVDYDALATFRKQALNPESPVTRGTAQNPDVFFQAREASNPYYDAVPSIVEGYLAEINKLTGRDYKLFNYYGAADAENIIIAMGSVTEAIKETIDALAAKGEKIGLVHVHLYRPFSAKHFISALPKSTKRICVLDRTKEPGAGGEPLYLDIKNVLYGTPNAPLVIGGRYGLSSKDVSPKSILAIIRNLQQAEPKDQFTVGIVDDVTFTSLPEIEDISTADAGTVECKFYGLGSDGTVGANKNSIKIIGDNTPMFAQGYFAYDSKKSGGITTSHLRFGKLPIKSTYLVINPDFVSCSEPSYLVKYDMLKGIKKGGTFLLNSIFNEEDTVRTLPSSVKAQLAKQEVNFYILNATQIGEEIGLGKRTNSIMQAAFFKLANVIPFDEAVEYMKTAVKKSYGKKGDDIVAMNFKAIDRGALDLVKVKVDPSWTSLTPIFVSDISVEAPGANARMSQFIKTIAGPINQLEGDDIPVSAFSDFVDGTMPNGSAQFEKRGIAVNVPQWNADNCIQCNQCAYVCPHAVIRPFLLDATEKANAPEMATLAAKGKGLEAFEYRIQVSTLDCTGCAVCAEVCPAPGKALFMEPLASQTEIEIPNWDYLASKVTYKDSVMKKNTVKGSQFAQPLFEFSGACAGCGETPYITLMTQLFGERMTIANATGCSSIYGGSSPATPYTTNAKGQGPAWANSLFEDNAEFGFGITIAQTKLRDRLRSKLDIGKSTLSDAAKLAVDGWETTYDNGEENQVTTSTLVEALQKDSSPLAKEVLEMKQYLGKKSNWVLGGDGWAYDIGFGGVDHVLASGADINIMVLDTEMYSNTGGQASKSTPTSSVAKFAANGKPVRKKDLGRMAMTYGYVYVAQVAMGANQNQLLKAMIEAEAHPGPSLIIAYSPCISHGIKKGGMSMMQAQQKVAVESGYWHLFRFNPALEAEGKNPFTLDSKSPDFGKYRAFINGEVRFSSLSGLFPDIAEDLFTQAEEDAKWRDRQYRLLASMDYSGIK